MFSTLVLAAVGAGSAQAGTGNSVLSNGFVKLTLRGGSIVEMLTDPAGKSPAGQSFIKGLDAEFWQETPDTRVEISGERATVSPLQVWWYEPIGIGGDQPVMLESGKTLAQTFAIGPDTKFGSVSIKIPTWQSKNSCATLSLYRGKELVLSKRLKNVMDNSWPALTFKEPLGAGQYTIELSDPVGQIGWWSGEKSRSLQVDARRVIGTGSLDLTLDRNRLTVKAELRPRGEMKLKTLPWRWRTTWTQSGYDCTPKAGVVFSRFFSDNLRYMPVEQLKRRKTGTHAFDGCKWIEMDGTRDADLRLAAEALHLHWELQPKEMHLRFDSPLQRKGDVYTSEFSLTILPREDSIPAEFPRFGCSDKKLEADVNRFFWERNFTYGSPAVPSAEWMEWSALTRAWIPGWFGEAEKKLLLDYPITPEGYVYTSRDSLCWPLVNDDSYDNRHYDTNARFILACRRHYLWTGDLDFLRGQADRLRSAMRYQLEVLGGKDGLIVTPAKKTGRHKGVSDNYWDILPFGHLDAYANAYFYGSIVAMEQIEDILGGDSLTDYHALKKLAHKRYDEVFWDEKAGRYIGCVDIDGVRHDLGFTFVNLEALYYGLGDFQRARRIYGWMETEPTSSGVADTYSKWIFAPRATTIHNPMWGDNAPAREKKVPTKPWHVFWWPGTPFGDQCQDGGGILYTSFYDLMDRVKYRGTQNAWARFGEIMERYRMPDRLCGGSPLYRGEISQQENAGAVGVDLPFPESALVPCYFLYGIIGIEPTPEGLRITPNLPKGLDYAEVDSLSWHGKKLRVQVTRTSVEISGDLERRYAVKAGDGVLVEE